MLGQRIVTAVVLLALLVPAMLSSAGWPFPLLTMALVAAAGWEWARLNGAGSVMALGFGAVLFVACLGSAPLAVQAWAPGPPGNLLGQRSGGKAQRAMMAVKSRRKGR
jgi:phosphatidate cytidylyltransferase